MSLLGRLEDLSLGDIIQIVYLSRRTGTLEVTTGEGVYQLLFRTGLLVDVRSDTLPPLIEWLHEHGIADPSDIASDALAEAVRQRMVDAVAPLINSHEGEFSFALVDDPRAITLDYDADALFKEGGLPPPRVLGAVEKPLKALEESLRAGKAMLRTASPPPENVVAFPAATQIADETAPLGNKPLGAKYRVSGGIIEVDALDTRARNVVLFERDALLRVAAKRAFAKREITIAQFGLLEDVRKAVGEWVRQNAFFVTVLEAGDGSTVLLRDIKRKNQRLPVAIIDRELDLKRRHDLLKMGADFYLTKPEGTGEKELSLFAEELVVFAEKAFDQWDQVAAHWGGDAGRRFYDEAARDHAERSFEVLKHFISELSNPNDIGELATTILRLASQYVDRAVVFAVYGDAFVSVGEGPLIRLARHQPSILSDVAATGEPHRGKIKRTPANAALMERLGESLPTEVIALPIVHKGQTIGILYGDNATHRAPIESLSGLEVFLSQAGYAFGNAVAANERAGAP